MACFPQRAWIGLYDDMNSWKWSMPDGNSEYRHWASGEPNNQMIREVCVLMYDSGLWDDRLCDQSIEPVCTEVKGEICN